MASQAQGGLQQHEELGGAAENAKISTVLLDTVALPVPVVELPMITQGSAGKKRQRTLLFVFLPLIRAEPIDIPVIMSFVFFAVRSLPLRPQFLVFIGSCSRDPEAPQGN